jgi:hypothetical protein
MKSLKGRKYLDAMCVYFWATTPVLVSLLSFGTYVLLGNQLTAAKVRFCTICKIYSWHISNFEVHRQVMLNISIYSVCSLKKH